MPWASRSRGIFSSAPMRSLSSCKVRFRPDPLFLLADTYFVFDRRSIIDLTTRRRVENARAQHTTPS